MKHLILLLFAATIVCGCVNPIIEEPTDDTEVPGGIDESIDDYEEGNVIDTTVTEED